MTSVLRLKHIMGLIFAVGFGVSGQLTTNAFAQQADFGVNLSGGKEPVQMNADELEMHDKDGVAIFKGNVSVVQGDRILRTSKLIVHYAKAPDAATTTATQTAAPAPSTGGLGSTGVEKMEASGKVYVKTATQVATGDEGVFDAKSNTMILTGSHVVLTDGDNVATGCKLTANMKTGKALLESCKSSKQKGRVSIIMNRNDQNGK